MGALALVVVGCEPAHDVPDVGPGLDTNPGGDVLFTIPDMRTGVDPGPLTEGLEWARIGVRLTSISRFPDREVPQWEGLLRVVRWPSGEIVPGTWAYDDVSSTFHFRVAGPFFDEGWFAIQAELGRVGRRARDNSLPIVEGWSTSRFRIGSQPLATLSYYLGDFSPDYGAIEITCSENAEVSEVRRFSEHIDVSVDGEPRTCTAMDETNDTFGPSPLFEEPRPFYTASVECGFVPNGALVEVMMRDGLTDLPLTDYRGVSPPRWSFRVGDDPRMPPADALFRSSSL
ncbi:MAG: hypothetical protein J0L92_32175 [Deltaproteobacteria bacterium]|nr:hypothetical protein [Deltaproteobacteria bacterium]